MFTPYQGRGKLKVNNKCNDRAIKEIIYLNESKYQKEDCINEKFRGIAEYIVIKVRSTFNNRLLVIRLKFIVGYNQIRKREVIINNNQNMNKCVLYYEKESQKYVVRYDFY